MAENKNSRARIEANNRYNAKAYDCINVAVPKGRKDIIKAHAEKNGESVLLMKQCSVTANNSQGKL